MTNVTALPGSKIPSGQPNEHLIAALKSLLASAEAGELQSFIGTGFGGVGGQRHVLWADLHANLYEMQGALSWLQFEYVHLHMTGKK